MNNLKERIEKTKDWRTYHLTEGECILKNQIAIMEYLLKLTEVKNLNISDVSTSLPLNQIVKESKAGGYYCNIKDGNNLIATQGETVLETLENIVDAYKTLKAFGNEC